MAFHWAAEVGFDVVVLLRLQRGTKPMFWSSTRCTPLMCASSREDLAAATALLDNPRGAATLNWSDALNNTKALQRAAQGGHGNVVRLLLRRGADPTMRDAAAGLTPPSGAPQC
jgi:ankyrin repeat protein